MLCRLSRRSVHGRQCVCKRLLNQKHVSNFKTGMSQRGLDDGDGMGRRLMQQLSWMQRLGNRPPSSRVITDQAFWMPQQPQPSSAQSVGFGSTAAPSAVPPAGTPFIQSTSALEPASFHAQGGNKRVSWSAAAWDEPSASQSSHATPSSYNPATPPCLRHVLPPAESAKFSLSETLKNGDSLFASVKIILESIGTFYTINHLRRVVAYPVLNTHDKETNDSIRTWLSLIQQAKADKNKELMEHCSHLKPFQDAKYPLSPKQRKELYACLLKRSYAGDEHALRVLESQLQVRFLVLDGTYCTARYPVVHAPERQFRPQYCAMLYAESGHYSPISYNGQFVWRLDQLPTSVRFLFRQM